jgi:DNA helicase-2/ATP-dependent DNA helicase PcrA
VQFINFASQEDELSFVAEQIKKIYQEKNSQEEKIDWLDFAVLIRANDTAEAYVKEFVRQSIPHQFMSWRGLYYKPIILDILAYFRLLDNYHESAALFRVLSMDAFKVSHSDMISINKQANRKVWSLYEALQKQDTIKNLNPDSSKNITKLLDLIKIHSLLVASEKPTKIFLHFAYDSGLLEKLDRDKDLEVFSYLNQFYQKIKSLEDNSPDLKLKDFLEAINLEIEAGDTGSLKLDFADNDTVKIMTVHGAKGLEFKHVFIVNLVDKKFPTISRGEKLPIPEKLIKEAVDTSQNFHIEEERRLFYVAVTRAKESLYLTAARDYGGAKEKKPSRFIEEMGLSNIEADSDISLSKANLFLKDLHNLHQEEDSFLTRKPEFNNYVLPEKFSFSQLAAFANCPLQYKFAFILKIPAPIDKPALIFGRVLHNTLYNFLLPFISGVKEMQASLFIDDAKKSQAKELTEKKLLSLYQEFWQADGFNSKEERQEYYQKGIKALTSFFHNYTSKTPAEILFLEKKFSFRIGSDIIKGTIDRVDRLADGSVEIIDYKTGREKEKLEFKDKRQLILYQVFLEEFLSLKVTALSYYYLESGVKLSFKATTKEIEKLKLGIQEEILAIKKKQFNPKPSLMCAYCDFNTICEFRQS